MDAATRAWIDQDSARLTATIRRFGWSIEYFGSDACPLPGCDCPPFDGPPFAYTVGLFGLDHPELLIFGVPTTIAAGVLNELCERVRDGESLLPGQMIRFDAWTHRIVAEVVANPGSIVPTANAYYCRPAEFSVPVLQFSYDDKAGVFPFQDAYAAPEMQPRPGAFKA